MRPTAALTAWLDDPAAQVRALTGQSTFASGWSALIDPAARRLDAVAASPIDDIIAACAALLADCGWAERCIAMAARSLAAEPLGDLPLRMISDRRQRGLVLVDQAAAAIVATVTFSDALDAEGRGPITFSGAHGVIRFVRGGNAMLARWRLDRRGRCARIGTRRVRDGDIVHVDGHHEALSIEAADADIVSLRAIIKAGRAPLSHDHERTGGALVRQTAADPDASRTQMMLALLRLAGRRDASPLFADAIRAPEAYPRWQAMREWLALDTDAALPHLQRLAANDPDAGIRRVAARVLARIG